jgi:tRNA (cmo5U34)-methyltransferase
MKIPKSWTFKNEGVAENFDEHVRESLPWYDLATKTLAHVVRHYVTEGGIVYDIGCSTGNVGNALKETIEERKVEFMPIDNSPEMAKLYKAPGMPPFIWDAVSFHYRPFDVAICFLSLMFIPPGEREELLKTLRKNCKKGGAIIVFDRCLPLSGYPSLILSRLTLVNKLIAGIDSSEILAKELSLIGIQRPIDAETLEPCVEIFRLGDFAGWILEC